MNDLKLENEVNPVINSSQYRGVLERSIIFAIAWFLGQVNLPIEMQDGIAAILIPFITGALSILGGLWFNRNTALVVKAASLPEVHSVRMTTAKAAKAIDTDNVIPPVVYKAPEPLVGIINHKPKPSKGRRR